MQYECRPCEGGFVSTDCWVHEWLWIPIDAHAGCDWECMPELQAGLKPDQKADVDKNCLDGAPVKTAEALGPTEMVYREGYVLDTVRPTRFHFGFVRASTKSQLTGSEGRSDKFKTDPMLKGPHSTPADYNRTGYDRGHQARRPGTRRPMRI